MPNADGRFLGMSVPAKAWERIFGTPAEDPPNKCCGAFSKDSEKCQKMCGSDDK
jgi:hypothetical protein